MGETTNTMEQRNESQRRTIEKQVEQIKDLKTKVKELEVWERFAAYLLHNCEGQSVAEENLQTWLAAMLEAEKK